MVYGRFKKIWLSFERPVILEYAFREHSVRVASAYIISLRLGSLQIMIFILPIFGKCGLF